MLLADYILQLNDKDISKRLAALRGILHLESTGEKKAPLGSDYVNNHIHTVYSFSPYSPSAAVYFAREAGLTTAGIMDHDSVGGIREFLQAGEIMSLPVTCGFECRVSMSSTDLKSKRINNPDQLSNAYVALHAIPHKSIDLCEAFLKPYREKRNIRNRKMTDKINDIVSAYGISLNFDSDILPLSFNHDNGSVTERHILFALSLAIISKFGKGIQTVEFIKNILKINLSLTVEGYLNDDKNKFYEYDLLGALKSNFVPLFYIEATDECPHVSEFIDFAKKSGAISAYAYLGDVTSSVTGDKKAQKFEDDYIEELFAILSDLGFNAVTYMPSRNTIDQLKRVMGLCEQHSLMQISGEDINTPRQSFICKELLKPEFKHLSDSTWKLIEHENA